MTEIKVAVITAIITGLLSQLPKLIKASPRLYAEIKNNTSRKKRILFVILRYLFLIAAILLCFLYLEFNKTFIIFIIALILLGSYFITTDVLSFTLYSFIHSMKKEDVEKEYRLWIDQLAQCDRKDKERQQMIKDKIGKLDESLKTGSYKKEL